jgi:hypothetical protein
MNSLKEIKSLPAEIQKRIEDEFGGAESLHQKVFELHTESVLLNKTKPKNYLPRIIEIRDELYKIEDKLDGFGLVGYKLISRVSDEIAEIEITKLVDELKINLKQHGSSSEEMKAWIKKHFEVV